MPCWSFSWALSLPHSFPLDDSYSTLRLPFLAASGSSSTVLLQSATSSKFLLTLSLQLTGCLMSISGSICRVSENLSSSSSQGFKGMLLNRTATDSYSLTVFPSRIVLPSLMIGLADSFGLALCLSSSHQMRSGCSVSPHSASIPVIWARLNSLYAEKLFPYSPSEHAYLTCLPTQN